MMNTTVSIIICTRNRAEFLRPTLQSIGQMTVPAGCGVELLVIDNGSTDHTWDVVKETGISKFPVRYVSEPRVGKCHAYNTGLAKAVGEVLLFTDDDVRVPASWIEGMCGPIWQGGADAVAGGVMFPVHIQRQLEASVFRNRRGWVASSHYLDPYCPGQMIGANMAVHRRVLEKVSGFDIELGPGALGSFEETLFSFQLLAAGYRLVGALDVAVEHHFDTRRLTAACALATARMMGRSHAFMFHHWARQKSRLVVPRLILCHIRRFIAGCFQNSKRESEWVSDQTIQMEYDLAFYREYLVQRDRRQKYAPRPPVPQTDPAARCLPVH